MIPDRSSRGLCLQAKQQTSNPYLAKEPQATANATQTTHLSRIAFDDVLDENSGNRLFALPLSIITTFHAGLQLDLIRF